MAAKSKKKNPPVVATAEQARDIFRQASVLFDTLQGALRSAEDCYAPGPIPETYRKLLEDGISATFELKSRFDL